MFFFGYYLFFFFKQKTAYDMRISDWSSDVCSSDLPSGAPPRSRAANDRGSRTAPGNRAQDHTPAKRTAAVVKGRPAGSSALRRWLAHIPAAERGKRDPSLKPTTRIPAFVERAHGGEHFIDRYGAFCARGFAKRRLVSHGRSIRCPGCEDGTLHFGFQIRMPRNIKGVKKTCVGLRHGQNSFPCVAPFVDAGQTRTGEFWFRSESRQEASWTRLALQRQECQKISFRLLNGKIGFPSSAKPVIRMNGRVVKTFFSSGGFSMHFRPFPAP